MAVCPHSANFAPSKQKYNNIIISKMDMFIMAVRLLGAVAEMKEKTHKIFG